MQERRFQFAQFAQVIQNIPIEYQGEEINYLDLDQDFFPVERALGVKWVQLSNNIEGQTMH